MDSIILDLGRMSLFLDYLTISVYTAPNDKMHNGLGIIQVSSLGLIYSSLLSHSLCGGAEENYENLNQC